MTGADGEADAPSLSIEDHVEAFHDNGSHYCARAGLRHSKLIAVLLGRCHVLHRPQVLLQVNTTCLRGTSQQISAVFAFGTVRAIFIYFLFLF